MLESLHLLLSITARWDLSSGHSERITPAVHKTQVRAWSLCEKCADVFVHFFFLSRMKNLQKVVVFTLPTASVRFVL